MTLVDAIVSTQPPRTVNPGYSARMTPTDPVDDELDAEELDLVAGGAQPSEQEPFSPGTYTIN